MYTHLERDFYILIRKIHESQFYEIYIIQLFNSFMYSPFVKEQHFMMLLVFSWYVTFCLSALDNQAASVIAKSEANQTTPE